MIAVPAGSCGCLLQTLAGATPVEGGAPMKLFEDPASSANATVVDAILTMTVSATGVLDGELDCSTEREVERRIARLAESADVIRIDARQVAFIDAAGVRTLLLAERDALQSGATMMVQISSPGPVERVFQLAGLNGWFDGPVATDTAGRCTRQRAPSLGTLFTGR
jgi:anti-anti-sigma factor